MKKLSIAILLLMLSNCQTLPEQQEEINNINKIKNIHPEMKNNSFSTSFRVKEDPLKIYQHIMNFRAWWSEDIEGATDIPGETFFYHYKEIHLCRLKLIEAVPGKRLVYEVVQNEFNFIKDKTEWMGTRLVFDIVPEGTETRVQFTHEGLVPEYECYKVCNEAWSGYIGNSLFRLITTGKGEPNPKDKDGFNAELARKWHLE